MAVGEGDKDKGGIVVSFNNARSARDVLDTVVRLLERQPVNAPQAQIIERFIKLDKARLQGRIQSGFFRDTEEPEDQAISMEQQVMEDIHETMKGWSQMDWFENHGPKLLTPLSEESRLQIEQHYGPEIERLENALSALEANPEGMSEDVLEEEKYYLSEKRLEYKKALTSTEGEWLQQYDVHQQVAGIVTTLDSVTPQQKQAYRNERFREGQLDFHKYMNMARQAAALGDDGSVERYKESAFMNLILKGRRHPEYAGLVKRLHENGDVSAQEKADLLGRDIKSVDISGSPAGYNDEGPTQG